ncbi:MAG: hypothetical protein Q4P32_00145 [Micrococcales bacterium]|nr:hypothetical protein [Micrococcales bacterium]
MTGHVTEEVSARIHEIGLESAAAVGAIRKTAETVNRVHGS